MIRYYWEFCMLGLVFMVLGSGCIADRQQGVVDKETEEAMSEAPSRNVTQDFEKDDEAVKKTKPIDEKSESEVSAAPIFPSLDRVLQRFQAGTRLLDQGENEQARTQFTALSEDYPDVAVFHLNLGVAYKRLERFQDAIASYRRAITLSKQNTDGVATEAHYNLGILLRELGDFEGAEMSYLQALLGSPEFPDAHFNLAVLYDLYLNRPAEAIRHYQLHKAFNEQADAKIDVWISALQKRLNGIGTSQ